LGGTPARIASSCTVPGRGPFRPHEALPIDALPIATAAIRPAAASRESFVVIDLCNPRSSLRSRVDHGEVQAESIAEIGAAKVEAGPDQPHLVADVESFRTDQPVGHGPVALDRRTLGIVDDDRRMRRVEPALAAREARGKQKEGGRAVECQLWNRRRLGDEGPQDAQIFDAVTHHTFGTEEHLAPPEHPAKPFGLERRNVRQAFRRRFGQVGNVRIAVAVSGKEQVTAKRTVGEWAWRQSHVDLIHLFLREAFQVVGRQRAALRIRERELAAQPRDVSTSRCESNKRRRRRAACAHDSNRRDERDEHTHNARPQCVRR
jgi:hypothetical protein